MNLFEKIKELVPLFNEVSADSVVFQSGSYLHTKCPVEDCNGKTTVSIPKNVFYCFDCGRGGDLITFKALKQNVSPLEAARLLINEWSLDIDFEEEAKQLNLNKTPEIEQKVPKIDAVEREKYKEWFRGIVKKFEKQGCIDDRQLDNIVQFTKHLDEA